MPIYSSTQMIKCVYIMKQLDFVSAEETETKLKKKLDKPKQKQELKSPTSSRKSPAGKKKAKRSVHARDGYQRLNVEIPRELHKEIKVQAIVEERSVTDLVLEAINTYLQDKS